MFLILHRKMVQHLKWKISNPLSEWYAKTNRELMYINKWALQTRLECTKLALSEWILITNRYYNKIFAPGKVGV